MKHVTASECGQAQTKINGEWANYAGFMLLGNDADVSIDIVPC